MLCVIDMNEKTEESVKNNISTDDLSSFEWRILKYMCSVTGIYDTFPEIILFHRTDLKASIDSKFSRISSEWRGSYLQIHYEQCNGVSNRSKCRRNSY
jgi:hypothetical protein